MIGGAMSDLLTTDRLVFNQKAKLIELNTEFKIRDTEGNEFSLYQRDESAPMPEGQPQG